MFRRKLRVRVDGNRGGARVGLRRIFQSGYDTIPVAYIDLTSDGADEQLANARMKARDMANQLNGLEA